MNRIISAIYTPRKPESEGVSSHWFQRAKDDDDGVDASGLSLDLGRTPIASKRNTPARPNLEKGTSLRPTSGKELTPPRSTSSAAATSMNPPPARPPRDVGAVDFGAPTSGTKKTGGASSSSAAAEAAKAKLTKAGMNEEGEEGVEGEEGDVFAFKGFKDYRWVENSVEIEVEWEGGEITWEPEVNLHQDAPDTLFAFWRDQGGRPTNPFDPDMFEVFAIRKHSKDRKRFLVEWVGYEPKDASWVPQRSLEETVGDVLSDYWDSLDVKPKKGKKRKSS